MTIPATFTIKVSNPSILNTLIGLYYDKKGALEYPLTYSFGQYWIPSADAVGTWQFTYYIPNSWECEGDYGGLSP